MSITRSKVMVLAGSGDNSIATMFLRHGYIITKEINEADLLCFVGGADVSPNLYNQYQHESTRSNTERDSRETNIYKQALELGIAMVGICRGGQFLNVMNGGSLYQDVDNHAVGSVHNAYLVGSYQPVKVSSTHHQMMIPTKDGKVLLRAGESENKLQMSPLLDKKTGGAGPRLVIRSREKDIKNNLADVESVYYPDTKCLCFQPHPEFGGDIYKETTKVFFDLIDNTIFAPFEADTPKVE